MFKKKNEPVCGALILAAGSGRRMELGEGNDTNKVFLDIGGMPVIAHTLLAFERCKKIDKIVVATRECDIPLCHEVAKDFGITKLVSIVSGGSERQHSVKNGLDELLGKCDFVAIHDGARCLIKESDIDKVVDEAFGFGAAALATPCTDTLKKAGKSMEISADVERQDVYRMQTPQVFEIDKFCAAHEKAAHDGFLSTDDCAVATYAGMNVKLVCGSASNMKLTTQDDMEIMNAILMNRLD